MDTPAPPLVPSNTQPSVYDIPQALYDSEINFRVEYFFDGEWTASLGDKLNGWKDEDEDATDFTEALLALRDMAIRHYPDSVFTAKYRGVTFSEENKH